MRHLVYLKLLDMMMMEYVQDSYVVLRKSRFVNEEQLITLMDLQ